MVAKLINGKDAAQALLDDIAAKIGAKKAEGISSPGLAVIMVGDHPASKIYVKNKRKTCEAVGMQSFEFDLPDTCSQDALLDLIQQLNEDPKIHGILVQLPLPSHIDQNLIVETISPYKDVDGFHPYNIGRLTQRRPLLRPCTPYGILHLIESTGFKVKGCKATIVGASNIVGRPMMLELILAGATVTICHRFTQNLPEECLSADLLIVAVGKPKFLQAEWIKPGAMVIDVGINRLEDGTLVGDVDFEAAKEVAGWITPVPGGVGPMTIASLLHNTLLAAEL